MTVLAYREGVLAGDKLSVISGVRAGNVTKVAKRESDGALVGIAGDAGLASGFMRWFLGGEQGDRPSMSADADNNALGIVVRPNGDVEEHGRFGWARVEGDFLAYGSGLEAALAAMHMGADAVRAVQVANAVCTGCGNGVDSVSLTPKALAAVA